jgi:hypothetical protein
VLFNNGNYIASYREAILSMDINGTLSNISNNQTGLWIIGIIIAIFCGSEKSSGGAKFQRDAEFS